MLARLWQRQQIWFISAYRRSLRTVTPGFTSDYFGSPPRTPCRRVVVSGLGLVSPLGVGVTKTWDKLLAGKTGVAGLTENHLPEVGNFSMMVNQRTCASLSLWKHTAEALLVHDRHTGQFSLNLRQRLQPALTKMSSKLHLGLQLQIPSAEHALYPMPCAQLPRLCKLQIGTLPVQRREL